MTLRSLLLLPSAAPCVVNMVVKANRFLGAYYTSCLLFALTLLYLLVAAIHGASNVGAGGIAAIGVALAHMLIVTMGLGIGWLLAAIAAWQVRRAIWLLLAETVVLGILIWQLYSLEP